MTGTVYLVGSGPGDPDLLTVRARRLLEEADVVLHDKLPGPEIIDLVPDGRREYVGKRAGGERTVLEELGGGCVAPVGIYAVLQGSVVRTSVRVLDREGEEEVRETRELPVDRHPQAAREFAADLADAGAADLIDRARRRTDEASGTGGASPESPVDDACGAGE